MKVLTWNILAEEWSDEKLDIHRNERLDIILKTLKNINADIILLQEVMICEYNEIKKVFKKDYVISNIEKSHWPGLKGESGLMKLVKRDIKNIKVVNLHLDDKSKLRRKTQLSEIVEDLEIFKKVVIGGDFNENITSDDFFNKLYRIGFKSALNENDFYHGKTTYIFGKQVLIDNIFFKGLKMINTYVLDKKCGNYRCQLESIGSDHYPVITILE